MPHDLSFYAILSKTFDQMKICSFTGNVWKYQSFTLLLALKYVEIFIIFWSIMGHFIP